MNLVTTGVDTWPQGHASLSVTRAVEKEPGTPGLVERAPQRESADLNSTLDSTHACWVPVEVASLGLSFPICKRRMKIFVFKASWL